MSLDQLFYFTFFLAFISIYITKKRLKTLITASTGYWFAWLFLLYSTKVAVNNGWIENLSEISLNYIVQLHSGAFLGFLLGTVFSSKKNKILNPEVLVKSNYIVKKLSNKILLFLFILGSLFLIERLRVVGFSLSYFTDVRSIYLETNDTSFIEWIAGHLSVMVGFLIILIGLRDAASEIDVKLLLKVLIASAPLGLANGSRIFLLNNVILYLSSILLARGMFRLKKTIISRTELIKITSFVLSILFIFALIGYNRGGYGGEFDLIFTILIWPVSTMMAADSWIAVAINSQNTGGMFTLGWVADFLNSFGILQFGNEKKMIQDIVIDFKLNANPAAVIPKSILPELIFDFGKKGVFWSIFFISFLAQKITIKFAGKGIVYHTIAVYCLVGSFMTIQTSIITPQFAVSIFWAIIFSYFIKSKLR